LDDGPARFSGARNDSHPVHERRFMQVDIEGGRVTFRRHIAVPAAGAIPPGVDANPGALNAAVQVDMGERAAGYVSLQSPNVRIAAAEFTITAMGNIEKVGWVNVIVQSDRRYHYAGGMVVTEEVINLPTWDGGADDARPYYFGNWFGTDPEEHEDGEDGCVGVLALNGAEDIILTDAPCLPPSYNVRQANGIPLGKFNAAPAGYLPDRITRVSGTDRYLACLMVSSANARSVAWSVPWDVTYAAAVTAGHDGLPQVALDATARTRVNTGGPYDAAALIGQVIGKAAGETLKRYTRNQPARYVRAPGLVRTKSTGDLRNLPY
jgi:hypothetical protein